MSAARRISPGLALTAALCFLSLPGSNSALAQVPQFRVQQIFDRLTVGYATRLLDLNRDGKTDILVVDADRVIWFENPTWTMHTPLAGQTKRDNVSIAVADIDRDGQLDFALAADWRPSDTRNSGSLAWLKSGKTVLDPWTLHPIGTEPTIHRIGFADLDADGREELLVVPLFGNGATPPKFAEQPVRILAYPIPADPIQGPWVPQVINEELHVAHNFLPTDLDHDGKLDLLVASFEGVSWLKRQPDGAWQRQRIGSGNQATQPNRGASEIKHGRLASGADYLATIEPWHGSQVVVYTRPETVEKDSPAPLWQRHVLDEELRWGHAVWCADLDGDGDQELVVGVRDTKDASNPCGLRIYDPQNPTGTRWQRTLIDPAGVAIEDLSVADLDGDGRNDIVAVGRQTKNVRIYWNQKPETKTAAVAKDEFPRAILPNATGGELDLERARGRVATVLVSLSVDCPISSEYLATLERVAQKYADRGVRLVGIAPGATPPREQLAAHAKEHRLTFPVLQDPGAKVSRQLRWQVTPEVCVFDAAGTLVYRGRIDDRYRAGGGQPGAQVTSDLERALDEVVAGKPVSVPKTKVVGCPIQWPSE